MQNDPYCVLHGDAMSFSPGVERHFTATGIVIDEHKRALVIRHKKLGVWLPPGGHVEPNETPDDAVLREIWEETGIAAAILPNGECQAAGDEWAHVLHTPYAVLLEDIGQRGTHFHIDLVYLCAASGQSGAANPQESTALRWMTLPEIEALDETEIYHNARHLVAKALKETI